MVKLKLSYDGQAANLVRVALQVVPKESKEACSRSPAQPSLSEDVAAVCNSLLDSVCGAKPGRSQLDEEETDNLRRPCPSAADAAQITDQPLPVSAEEDVAMGRLPCIQILFIPWHCNCH